jgi:hypothetical protein
MCSPLKWSLSSRTPVAEESDVLVSHERPQAVDVGHRSRAASRDDRQVQRRDLPVRLVIGMLEVGVTVQEGKAVAPRRRRASIGPSTPAG